MKQEVTETMVDYDVIQSWFSWLQDKHPTNNPLELIVAPPEYDSVGYDEETPVAFGNNARG